MFTYFCAVTPTPTPVVTNTPTPVVTNTPTPIPTDTPTAAPTNTPLPGDNIWILDATGCNGDVIEVDVMISNEFTAVDAFTFHFGYDTTVLEYVSCAPGTLDPGWTMFDCFESAPGDVTAGGFAMAPAEIPAGSIGSLVTLTFNVNCPLCVNFDVSNMVIISLHDDIVDFTPADGVFTYFCDGTPTPTPVVTNTPTVVPTDTPTAIPTDTPTVVPTDTPTAIPTDTPTAVPTDTPTAVPTDTPTAVPTDTPTPTMTPSPTPTPACCDIDIFAWEITFDPPQALPGDIVEITALINNVGYRDVNYTEVYFAYELTPLDPSDDPNMAVIGSPVILTNIMSGTTTAAVTTWDTTGLEPVVYPVYVYLRNTDPEDCDPGSYTQTDYTVPVELLSLVAIPDNCSTELRWTTITETNNIGFHIYRNSSYFGDFHQISETMIPGAGTSYTKHDYEYTVVDIVNGVPYFYRLAMVDGSGELTWSPIVSAVPNEYGIKTLIGTGTNRKIYSVHTPLTVYSGIQNYGSDANITVRIALLINNEFVADIVPPTAITISSGLDLNFELLHHNWLGVEPEGDYLIATILQDTATGDLVHLDISEFMFLGDN